MLTKMDIGICTYVLMGIPGLSLGESIEETKKTIINIVNVYKKYCCRGRIALFPIFIAPNSELENLFYQGKYQLMNLEEIIEVLHCLKNKINFKKWPIFIGLDDEGISDNRYPGFNNSRQIKSLIKKFNFNQNIALLNSRKTEKEHLLPQLT